ncbi:hypothetical protein, partial [Enterococcus faecium]
MPSIFPSAAILDQKYALLSSLRAQGYEIASPAEGRPASGDLFLIAAGEVPTAPARTLILGDEGRAITPWRDGAAA